MNKHYNHHVFKNHNVCDYQKTSARTTTPLTETTMISVVKHIDTAENLTKQIASTVVVGYHLAVGNLKTSTISSWSHK